MNDTERARLIAVLTHLKVPFDRKQISKLPASQNRPALDYVNHAHVTNRLNAQAEDWSYTVDESFTHGGEFWIRGTMTICGVSRVEYGKGKDPLEAASHFIRRAAMRFGVATDLWAKEDFEKDSWGSSIPQEAPDAGLAATSGANRAAAPGPSVGQRTGAAAQRAADAGMKVALTSRGGAPATASAADRPGGSETHGEDVSGSPGEPSGGVEPDRVVAPAPPPDEPHEHVKGKQLASGSWLCSFEFPDGRICGEKFKPAPTVFTAPVQKRADIS